MLAEFGEVAREEKQNIVISPYWKQRVTQRENIPFKWKNAKNLSIMHIELCNEEVAITIAASNHDGHHQSVRDRPLKEVDLCTFFFASL